MALPRSDAEGYILDLDACSCGISGVLSQEQDGKSLSIRPFLNRAETNYCVTGKSFWPLSILLNISGTIC